MEQCKELVYQILSFIDHFPVTTVSPADKEQQRRRELRKIKKKYLLAGVDYSQREPSRVNPAYKDRAEERRVTVGSDNPYQRDDMPASVDRWFNQLLLNRSTVEPRYNEDLGTMKISLLYQVSFYIRVKNKEI